MERKERERGRSVRNVGIGSIMQSSRLFFFLHINIHALAWCCDLGNINTCQGLATLDDLDGLGSHEPCDGRVLGHRVGRVDIGQRKRRCDAGRSVGSNEDGHLELCDLVRNASVVHGVRGQ